MGYENVTATGVSAADIGLPVAGTTMQANTVSQMANALQALLSHTHVFYDDYGTACNCNCNCNCQCTRGSL